MSGVHPATGSRVEYDSLAGPEQELSQGARRLFRTCRLVRLFNPYGRRWIRHQNFALAAPCFRFAQRLGHNAKVGNAGSENAVEVFGLFVHGNLLAPHNSARFCTSIALTTTHSSCTCYGSPRQPWCDSGGTGFLTQTRKELSQHPVVQ